MLWTCTRTGRFNSITQSLSQTCTRTGRFNSITQSLTLTDMYTDRQIQLNHSLTLTDCHWHMLTCMLTSNLWATLLINSASSSDSWMTNFSSSVNSRGWHCTDAFLGYFQLVCIAMSTSSGTAYTMDTLSYILKFSHRILATALSYRKCNEFQEFVMTFKAYISYITCLSTAWQKAEYTTGEVGNFVTALLLSYAKN